jgi:hypothetical protein
VEAVVAETPGGRVIFGVIDGMKRKGVEGTSDIEARKQLLRKFGYKLSRTAPPLRRSCRGAPLGLTGRM